MDNINKDYVWKFEDTNVYHTLVGPMNSNLKMLMLELDDEILEHVIDNTICLYTEKKHNDIILRKFLEVFTELYNLK